MCSRYPYPLCVHCARHGPSGVIRNRSSGLPLRHPGRRALGGTNTSTSPSTLTVSCSMGPACWVEPTLLNPNPAPTYYPQHTHTHTPTPPELAGCHPEEGVSLVLDAPFSSRRTSCSTDCSERSYQSSGYGDTVCYTSDGDTDLGASDNDGYNCAPRFCMTTVVVHGSPGPSPRGDAPGARLMPTCPELGGGAMSPQGCLGSGHPRSGPRNSAPTPTRP